MTSLNYAIPSDDLSGGGGDTSASANYTLRDTAGQNIVGSAVSTDFAAQQGYRVGVPSGAGALNASFVDAIGGFIVSPVATFSTVMTNDTSATGVLSSSDSKIRVTNTRAVAPWSLTIAATDGPTSKWQSGTNLMAFNHPAGNNALTIDPATGTITPINLPCTNSDLSLGPAATFNEGVVDSITLMTAGGSAGTQCGWDLTGVDMTQTVNANQPSGAYSISMTITVA